VFLSEEILKEAEAGCHGTRDTIMALSDVATLCGDNSRAGEKRVKRMSRSIGELWFWTEDRTII
jgi:hypothetical protein